MQIKQYVILDLDNGEISLSVSEMEYIASYHCLGERLFDLGELDNSKIRELRKDYLHKKQTELHQKAFEVGEEIKKLEALEYHPFEEVDESLTR